MSKTTKGIYYPGDYTSVADIPKDLKEMAESIEKVIDNEAYDDTQIQEYISELKVKDTELEAENERLREDLNNTVPSISGSGENVTLNGTAKARFKSFEISGNSWQETRSGKNLTNYEDWTRISAVGSLNISKDTLTYSVVNNSYGLWDIERILKANTAYTAFCDYTFSGTFGSQYGIRVKRGETWDLPANSNILNFTTDDTGKIILAFYIGTPYTGENATLAIKNIRLYEGTYTADNIPDYEQYGAMPSLEFKSPIKNVTGNANVTVCNKNFFDSKAIPNFQGGSSGVKLEYNDGVIVLSDNSNSSGYTNTTKTLRELCPALKVGDVAYLCLETTNTTKYIYLNGTNETWTNGKSKTITQDMLDGNVSIYGGNTQTDTLKIQVTLNEPSSEYKPHKSQQISFPLAEGQKLMKGDYLADDGIHHKRGQVVLTGNETGWNYNSAQNAFWIKNTEISNCKNEAHAKLCNYFPYSSSSFNVAEINTLCENSNSTNLMFTFKVDTSVASDLTKWKAFLSERYANGKPVIVEYDLAEEEIEAYTPEQQVVHNEIKKTAHSYGEQTHIFCTDETSLIFDVEAKADIQAMFNNLQAQILAGEV